MTSALCKMPEPKTFKFSIESGVASITLSRADKLNALTFAIYNELADTFAALDSVNEVRAIMITGEGRAFCSGGDVEDIIGELF
ncbi:MAG: enoyl-CoA hydratase-related protein, partial [Polyangiaceae bacterium]